VLERSKQAGAWYFTYLQKFGEPPERFWRHDELVAMYREEHPDWDEGRLDQAAQAIVAVQQEDLRLRYNSQRRYHQHNTQVGLNTQEADDPDQLLTGY